MSKTSISLLINYKFEITRLVITLMSVFILSLVVPETVNATTITVNPGQSINNVINNSSEGDLIIVNSGTYDIDTINLRKNNIILKANGAVTLQGGIEIYGNNNVISGFAFTDPNQKTAIRTYGNNNLIEKNEIYNMMEDPIWFWGKGNTFRNNYMHDIYDDRDWPNYDEHVDCFMTWNWMGETDNITIEDNICILDRPHGSNQFFILTHSGQNPHPIKNITFKNNVFITYDTGYVPIAFYGDSTITGIKILNNTFYSVTGQAADAVYLSNMPEVNITNNAVIGYSGVIKNVSSSNPTQSNNVLNPTGLGDYRNYNVTRDESGSFRISGFLPITGSNLVNSGSNLINLGVNKDFRGIIRPQGSSFDIGAFELTDDTNTPSFNISDLEPDGDVDGNDFNILISNFGLTGVLGFIRSDILKNGVVDIFDFNKLISNWGI